MKYLLTVAIMLMGSTLIGQEPPSPEPLLLDMKLAELRYEVKDNVFIKVTGADENLRIKILDPALIRVDSFKLSEKGTFLFQACKEGRYLIEASDSDEDIFQVIDVYSKLPDVLPEPDTKIGKDIFKELLKVDYEGVQEHSEAIAEIFRANIGKEPAQKLINETFTEIREYLADKPNKKKWEGFFQFLQGYFMDQGLKSDDITGHRNLWLDTEKAFRSRSKRG